MSILNLKLVKNYSLSLTSATNCHTILIFKNIVVESSALIKNYPIYSVCSSNEGVF